MLVDFGFDLAGRREPRLRRGAILSTFGALAEIAPLVITLFVLEGVFEGRAKPEWIIWTTGALQLSVALSALFKSLGSTDSFIATYGLVCDARIRLADHLRRLPMGFWNKQRSGAISSVLTDEFALYSEVVTHVWSLLIASLAKPLGICIFIIFLDWRLGLVASAAFALGGIAIPWSHKVLNRAADRLSEVKSRAHSRLVEYAQGVETLKDFGQNQHFGQKLNRVLDELEGEQLRMEVAPAPLVLSFKLVVWFGFCAVLALGAYFVAQGSIAPTRLILVLIFSLQLFEGASEISTFVVLARFSSRTLARIRELFEEPEQRSSTDRNLDPSSLAPYGIEINEVSFAYEDRPTLHKVSAKLPPHTVTALVGRSGSGKSTLAHLVNRLWDIEQGSIRIGGQELRDIPLDRLRQTVSMVLQDVVLFQDTVENNIRLGRPEASRTEVIAAARAAQAHEFIQALPQGYDTLLHEGGNDLSGGQRQRLAIARALLHDAPILVLDEATSAVDFENEALIQSALTTLMQGRTVLVIAHRLWTIQNADQILVLDEGRIVQRGRHKTLLDEDGLYRQLWDLQQQSGGWSMGVSHPKP